MEAVHLELSRLLMNWDETTIEQKLVKVKVALLSVDIALREVLLKKGE